MRRILGTSILMVVVMTVITGLAYPLVLTGIAQVTLHGQANGSLVKNAQGQVVGSGLIGQSFSNAKGNPIPKYFQPRPSGAGAAGYDAMASAAANLGPSNPVLLKGVRQLAASYRTFNNLAANAQVPVDAVTTSASGLDPEISIANARLQAARVAQARSIPLSTVNHLIDQATQGRVIGIWVSQG